MSTSNKKKRNSRTGVYYNGEQIVYSDSSEKPAVPKERDPLAFVVPWQITDNRKNR